MGYKDRDIILLNMGFNSYNSYLQSDLWVAIRTRKLKQVGHKCRICGEHTTVLHHLSYDISVLQGRNLKKLVALCESHHKMIEFRPDGSKTSHAEANKKLADLLGNIKIRDDTKILPKRKSRRFHPKKGKCHSFK